VDTISEGPAAIAISLGGARKAYAHTDPNEDAAAFALGAGGSLVAVADGHRGFEASEVLLDHLITHPAPQWTAPGGISPDNWGRHALAALSDANGQILRERLNSEHGAARTTLALALVLPDEPRLLYASVGDSHLFVERPGKVVDLAHFEDNQTFFLGHCEESPESLSRKCVVGIVDVADARALVLVTDGLSERHVGVEDPGAAVVEAVERAATAPAALRAARAAREVTETACRAHCRNPSGDNVAAAVLWLAGSD
jgi:serine/threonine protein phosphatase PrpC